MLRLQPHSRISVSYSPDEWLDTSSVFMLGVPVPAPIFAMFFFPQVGSVQSISSCKFHKTFKGWHSRFPRHSERLHDATETKQKWNILRASLTAVQRRERGLPWAHAVSWTTISNLPFAPDTTTATATTWSGAWGEESTGADVQPLNFAANPRCFCCLLTTQCQSQPLRR